MKPPRWLRKGRGGPAQQGHGGPGRKGREGPAGQGREGPAWQGCGGPGRKGHGGPGQKGHEGPAGQGHGGPSRQRWGCNRAFKQGSFSRERFRESGHSKHPPGRDGGDSPGMARCPHAVPAVAKQRIPTEKPPSPSSPPGAEAPPPPRQLQGQTPGTKKAELGSGSGPG